MIKKKKCQSTKRAKIVKNPNGRKKNRKIAKNQRKIEKSNKNDCHRYKLEARRAVRYYTS